MTDSSTPARRRPRVLRRVLIITGSVVGVIVLGAAALIGSFFVLGWQNGQEQISRFEARAAEVEAMPDAEKASWVDTAGDSGVPDALPFNRLQVIATHNSYAVEPTWLQLRIIDLVEPGQAATLEYEHAPLWDQLDSGIRSMEIDVRWNGESFGVSHVPLVANRSTMPDFALGMRELALWSEAHPGHLPISVMLEPKNDYMFLDPSLKPFDEAACDALDATITAAFGDRLFSPADLRGDAPSLREAVSSTGWPTVGELRGSVLFFYADNEDVHRLCADDDGRAVFASSRTGAEDAVFAVRDDPRDPSITDDLAAGLMVRVRADADLATSDAQRALALATGAQIVSTDFPPNAPQDGTGYRVELPGGALARATQ